MGTTLRRLSDYLELTRGQCLCLLLVTLGTLGDVVSTGVESTFLGTREANPSAIAMITHFGLFGYFIVKLVVVVSATLFLLRLVNRFLTRYPKRGGHQTIADLTILVCGGGGLILLGTTLLNAWVGMVLWVSVHGG